MLAVSDTQIFKSIDDTFIKLKMRESKDEWKNYNFWMQNTIKLLFINTEPKCAKRSIF